MSGGVAAPGSHTALDVTAGVRHVRTSADVSFVITGAVDTARLGLIRQGTRALARSGTMNWTDPVVGMRLRHKTRWGGEVLLRGDIGGFGIGSDFTWQAFGGYAHVWPQDGWDISAVVGYRALSLDYDEGAGNRRRGLDVVLHGPMMGVKFRW